MSKGSSENLGMLDAIVSVGTDYHIIWNLGQCSCTGLFGACGFDACSLNNSAAMSGGVNLSR